MKYLIHILIFLLPIGANAQPVSGLYVSLGSSLDNGGGREVNQPTPQPSPLDRTMRSSSGPAFEGAVGEGFGNGFRVELEGHSAR